MTALRDRLAAGSRRHARALSEGSGEDAIRRAFAAARTRVLMPKPWRLTRHAERALVEIARWTLETFGPRCAEAYEADLVACCAAIAAGEAYSRKTAAADRPRPAGGFALHAADKYFIVFFEMPDWVIVVDVLHGRS